MMEIVQRSVGVQVNLCNCHCFLDQSIQSNLPPRSPRASTRSRHHFRFNKALSMDNNQTLTEIGIGDRDRVHILGHSSGLWKKSNNSGIGSGNNLDSSITGGACHRDRELAYTQGYMYSHVGNVGIGICGSGQVPSHVNNSTSSRTASLSSEMDRMDSVSEEADENNKLLEFSLESTSSTAAMEHEDSSDNNIVGDQDKSSQVSRPLLSSTTSAGDGSGSNLNLCESNQNQTSPPASTSSSTDAVSWRRSHHQTAADILNKRESHSYHFKRKYNFRSDSVFSDVMPMPTSSSSQEAPKSPEAREKSGSLSSLKGQSSNSKWSSLRKKLGRLNSSSSSEKHKDKVSEGALEHQAHLHHQQQQKQKVPKTAKSSLEEKRSLLQRAKTLSILPVNRGVKEDVVVKKKEVPRPPELFNVGGEMNMIPLELLIDINDLKIQQ